jgi:hypothetical protein
MQTSFTIAIHLTRRKGAELPPGWLADASLVFEDGVLKGLSLVGFVIRHALAHPQRQSSASSGVKVGSDTEIAFPARSFTPPRGKLRREVRREQYLRATDESDNSQQLEAKLAGEIYAAYLAAVAVPRPPDDEADS